MEEEHKEAKGNPNGVVYAVAVKTDVEIIVGNLLQQISAACSLFLRWSGTIVCKVTGLGRASADLPKGSLKAFVRCSIPGKAKYWNKTDPIMIKQQRVYSSETLQQSSSVRPD